MCDICCGNSLCFHTLMCSSNEKNNSSFGHQTHNIRIPLTSSCLQSLLLFFPCQICLLVAWFALRLSHYPIPRLRNVIHQIAGTFITHDHRSDRSWLYKPFPIGSMYAIYGNIYHHYTPSVSIYTSTMDPMGFKGSQTQKPKHRWENGPGNPRLARSFFASSQVLFRHEIGHENTESNNH